MQFFLFDLALAFAALLGYRALEAGLLPRTPVLSLDSRAPVRAGDSMVSKPPRQCEPGRAAAHRLINFW
jgi:hypothetical protein